MTARIRVAWGLVALVIGVQILYPVTDGAAREAVIIVTVHSGAAAALWHATVTRGPRWTGAFVIIVAGGSFAVEVLGVATGWPFGAYHYEDALGPRVAGVPLLVPLAWTMLAYPAWLAAGWLAGPRHAARIPVAAWALAAWDLFLDPQMVAAGRWVWHHPSPALPGVPGVPVSNYLGWLGLSLVLMTALALVTPLAPDDRTGVGRAVSEVRWPTDAPPLVMYLWTYAGSLTAHLFFLDLPGSFSLESVFLDLPGSAWWGGLAMGAVAIPLAVRVGRAATRRSAQAPR